MLPRWVWDWMAWWIGEGAYKGLGPRNPLFRPPYAPARIPTYGWNRLKLLLRLRKPVSKDYDGICLNIGAWLRNPRGGVEGVLQAVQWGIYWFALNLNQGDWLLPASWDIVRSRAFHLNRPCGPWKRVYTISDVLDILDQAYLWSSPFAFINLEAEAKTSLPPYLVEDLIQAHPYEGEVVFITEAWVYNGVEQRPGTRDPKKNGWEPLLKYAIVLEILPREAFPATNPAACIAHAHELGFRNVFCAFDGRDPVPASLPPAFSVYTGDDAAGRWYQRG